MKKLIKKISETKVIKKISEAMDRTWDKIEKLMERIEKVVKPWILKNEVKIYKYTFIITALMMIAAYKQREYIAAGGEVLIPLFPFAIITYLKGEIE